MDVDSMDDAVLVDCYGYKDISERMHDSDTKDFCTCPDERGGPGLHHLECCPLHQAGIMYVNIDTSDGSIVIAENGLPERRINAHALWEMLKEHDPNDRVLRVTRCIECPHLHQPRYYTPDSFEMVFEWKCGSRDGRRIALVDAIRPRPGIPDWCPLEKAK